MFFTKDGNTSLRGILKNVEEAREWSQRLFDAMDFCAFTAQEVTPHDRARAVTKVQPEVQQALPADADDDQTQQRKSRVRRITVLSYSGGAVDDSETGAETEFTPVVNIPGRSGGISTQQRVDTEPTEEAKEANLEDEAIKTMVGTDAKPVPVPVRRVVEDQKESPEDEEKPLADIQTDVKTTDADNIKRIEATVEQTRNDINNFLRGKKPKESSRKPKNVTLDDVKKSKLSNFHICLVLASVRADSAINGAVLKDLATEVTNFLDYMNSQLGRFQVKGKEAFCNAIREQFMS